jgi:predicted RNA-binding Zn-ribbon protein involved in translation (DUF1610 family)
MMRVLEMGHFARKQIRVVEDAREPEPVLNILRQKETNRFGLSVLVCSLIRSSDVSASLVETRRNGVKGVLPTCNIGDRNLVLDLFDETSKGLDIRAGSKSLEILQFHIPEILQPAEGRSFEWVEEYAGDEERQRYRVRNFTNEEYDSLRNEIQTVEPSASVEPEPTKPIPSPPIHEPIITSRMKNAPKGMQVAVPSIPTEGKLTVPCPKCGSGLAIIRNRNTGKRFIGCMGRLERTTGCTFGLPLPQSGTITLVNKRCRKCGFELIRLKLRDRRPFDSCPSCYASSLQNH